MPAIKNKTSRNIKAGNKQKPASSNLEVNLNLETDSEMAGGFAHNFNNLLTIVAGNLQLIDARTVDPSIRKPLAEALTACETGAHMVEKLLTYSRQRHLVSQAHDVNDLITALLVIIRRIAGGDISVAFEPCKTLPRVRLDKIEFENALINLSLNARDAMAKGGFLQIKTAVKRKPDLVVVSVSDTGTGMPAHVAARACEAFFTTKTPGLGTGLGLSTVNGFVKQAGGRLEIESTVGKGTTVRMVFPAAKRANNDALT